MTRPLLPGVLLGVTVALALGACTSQQAALPAGLDSPGAADAPYCNQLATLYERFGGPQDRHGADIDASVAEAINECHGAREGAER